MTFIRHRDRMVQESIFEDLRNTLIACRWMAGTTSKPVRPVYPTLWTPGQPLATVTTAPEQVLALLENNPINLIDYFPEAEGEQEPGTSTPLNTFAVDTGRPGDTVEAELGSRLREQPYLFNMAFYAVSDAVAMAVMNDLRDRYEGSIVDGDGIDLYNYLGDTSIPAARMEVDSFRSARDAEKVAPNEVHLFFAELQLTDFVE